jgi:hypothetical protein
MQQKLFLCYVHTHSQLAGVDRLFRTAAISGIWSWKKNGKVNIVENP